MIWFSLPLGLAAWLLPLWAKNHRSTQKGQFSLLSAICCILSLLNVLWDLYRTALIGDYSALSDITNNLAICSILLLLGTGVCNWWLHGSLPAWLPIRTLLPGLRWFSITLGLQVLLLLPLAGSVVRQELFKSLYVIVMLGISAFLFVLYLHKTPKDQVSFGIPLAATLFPLVKSILHGDLYLSETIQTDLTNLYYQSCLLLTTTAVTFLRVQSWLHQRKKGEAP